MMCNRRVGASGGCIDTVLLENLCSVDVNCGSADSFCLLVHEEVGLTLGGGGKW
jgi:hypothetical protein